MIMTLKRVLKDREMNQNIRRSSLLIPLAERRLFSWHSGQHVRLLRGSIQLFYWAIARYTLDLMQRITIKKLNHFTNTVEINPTKSTVTIMCCLKITLYKWCSWKWRCKDKTIFHSFLHIFFSWYPWTQMLKRFSISFRIMHFHKMIIK